MIQQSITHFLYINEANEKKYILFCNCCCDNPVLNETTFTKGKSININIEKKELQTVYQRWEVQC